MLGMKLNDMLGSLYPDKTRKQKSTLAYTRRVIRRVNAVEDERDGQKKRSSTGEIKVRGISHKRAKQSDPRLAWIMFHKIVNMYRAVKTQEALYAQSLAVPISGESRKYR